MIRRSFIKNTVATGALGLTAFETLAQSQELKKESKISFKLNYAPHFGMFESHAGKDVIDQLKFMADQGFTALEDNGMPDKPIELQNKIGAELTRLNMKMGVFVVNMSTAWKPTLTTGKPEFRDQFLASCKSAVEVAKRVNAKWMTVVPGFFSRDLPIGIQTSNVIDTLRRACDIFEPHGLVMVLEPLSDTPDLFLRNSDQTFMICKAVKSPSCKLLFDIYHMQKNEGHIINNMNLTWDEIAYIQIGDNPGRNEPTSGEINYKNIFKNIYQKEFKGILGMEHGNSKPGKEGELALIEAYRISDAF
ncbi:MAG: TIM barrel protein [Bacteroidota bacterium]|nr:TIM barrel protein [Bacteroidota bacterium]